jgi:ParB/RepB/Spo0J family partition protein
MTGTSTTPIAEVLREGMAAKGLSGRGLGRAAGVDQSVISRLLSGAKADIETATARKLAGALEIPVARLLGDAAATETTPAAGGDPAVRLLALDDVCPSALNPRKTFDPEALEELAASIAADGVLQNLVVRLRPDRQLYTAPRFEIVAGERRYRALRLLAGRGQWDSAAATVPCRIVEADDDQHRALALLENLQRQDVPALEEAEAFKALHDLDGKRWSTAAIAARIGKTQRYVQQRLSLVTKLAEPAREALRAGTITIEQARIMAPAPAPVQKQLLKKMGEQWSNLDSPARLREALTRNKISAAVAIFPLDEYTGERLELDDDVYLCDREEFDRLQKRAAEIKVGELRRTWRWAELVEGWFRRADYEETLSQVRGKAGAVVVLDWSGAVEIHEGLVKRPEEAEADAADEDRCEAERAERLAQRDARRKAEEDFAADLAKALAGAEGPLRALLYGSLLNHQPEDVAPLLHLPVEQLQSGAQLWHALATMPYRDLSRLAPAVAVAGIVSADYFGSAGNPLAALATHYKVALPAHLAAAAAAADDEETGFEYVGPAAAGDPDQVDLEAAIAAAPEAAE